MSYVDEYSPYWRKVLKKMEGKPPGVQRLQYRSMNTATSILDNLEGIDFSKLSFSLYFYCQDLQMKQLTRPYEAQIELAGANPEKFFVGLHSFYNDISAKIKKNNLYQEFFEMYYRCIRLRQQNENQHIEDNVIVAYINLLTQNIDYFRPDKFNFETCVVGLSTKGELLITKDLFPNIDKPGFDLRKIAEKEIPYTMDDVFSIYKKYGYNINSVDELDIITNIDKIQTTTVDAILPFINEYTFDIIPQVPFSGLAIILDCITTTIDIEELKTRLQRRNKTLPSNGVEIHFKNSAIIQNLLLKEILFDNRIFLLYRMSTEHGDLCGYYDTKEKFFYTILNDYKEDPLLSQNIASLILFCYASITTSDPEYQLQKIYDHFTLKNAPLLVVEPYYRGGKLKNVYRPNDRPDHTGTARIGNDDYEKDNRAIQGFIRRLPAGQSASQEAIQYAESLGYSLKVNETYVRPFVKQVFKLKAKEPTG